MGLQLCPWGLSLSVSPPCMGREPHISFQDNKNICAKAEEEAEYSKASLPKPLDTV